LLTKRGQVFAVDELHGVVAERTVAPPLEQFHDAWMLIAPQAAQRDGFTPQCFALPGRHRLRHLDGGQLFRFAVRAPKHAAGPPFSHQLDDVVGPDAGWRVSLHCWGIHNRGMLPDPPPRRDHASHTPLASDAWVAGPTGLSVSLAAFDRVEGFAVRWPCSSTLDLQGASCSKPSAPSVAPVPVASSSTSAGFPIITRWCVGRGP